MRPERSGVRSGLLLGAASVVAIVANYVFLLAAGRLLGAEDYGSLAALLGLLTLVLLPAGALQMAVSREISRRMAADDAPGADAFTRATLRLAALATVPLIGIALALAVPLAGLLDIDTGLLVLAETTLITALVFPVCLGVLQGRQRFHALAALYVLPWIVRLVVLAIAVSAGYRLGGTIFATVVAAAVGTVTAFAMLHVPLRPLADEVRPSLHSFLRYLGPVAVGLIGIALLTHIDLLVVKARFGGDEAGSYGAASAFARIAFFVPATILAVLFPRTAARQARGEETEDILGRSLLATAAFCGGLALLYAAVGVGLVVASFGADFAEGGTVLAPFALATGLFSLAHVLVGYHLSRGETRYAWIVGIGVIAQVAVLALVPTSLRGVVWANVAVGVALLVSHELFVGSSVPAIRAGLRHARPAMAALRAVLPEAALVLLGTTAFACVLFWPVVTHMGTAIFGTPGSDSTASVAWFWQLKQEGYHVFGTTHHTLRGAPFGWDEGNGLNLQWLLPYYPGYLASFVVGEVAAYNLVVLSGYVLSGASMYLLVRYLGCARLVAAWAALVFMVFPWHVARAEHASLVHLEVLVLLVIALVAAARRPSWPRFAFVGVATLACWLTSGYFGAMAVVTVIAFSVGAGLMLGRRRGLLLAFGSTSAAVAATAIVSIPAFASGTGTDAGLDRRSVDLWTFGLRLYELVVPLRSLVLGHSFDGFFLARWHASNLMEARNYLGLLTIGLALGWVVLAVRRRATLAQRDRTVTAGLVVAFVVGVAFALPSPIRVLGHDVIWTPSRLLWDAVPAFRVPSRWLPLLMTVLVPLAALGLQAGSRALAARGSRGSALAAGAVGVAMIVSFLELAIPQLDTFGTSTPPEYAAVKKAPSGILAEYPLGGSYVYHLWQRSHGRPILNEAPTGSVGDEARLVLQDPAETGTAEALSLLGVTSIVIHPRSELAGIETWGVEVAPHEPTGQSGYQLVERSPDGASVWRVVASSAGALVTLPTGFATPKRENGHVGFALISPDGVASMEFRALDGGTVRLTFEAQSPDRTPRKLRIVDADREQAFTVNGRTTISTLVDVPRGTSKLLLKVDPPPASEQDAIVISAPRAERSSGTPVLHAEFVGPLTLPAS